MQRLLGNSWDGELSAGPLLAPLLGFSLLEYSEFIPGEERTLRVTVPSGEVEIRYEPFSDIATLLEALPSVNVVYDPGPPDQGPAGGSGYVFTMANGASEASVAGEIAALLTALTADLEELRAADE